jgi:hypothetical protein
MPPPRLTIIRYELIGGAIPPLARLPFVARLIDMHAPPSPASPSILQFMSYMHGMPRPPAIIRYGLICMYNPPSPGHHRRCGFRHMHTPNHKLLTIDSLW